MVRSALSAQLVLFQVVDRLALPDPGIATDRCFTSSQWYVCMCAILLFAWAATNQSLACAAASAGAKCLTLEDLRAGRDG